MGLQPPKKIYGHYLGYVQRIAGSTKKRGKGTLRGIARTIMGGVLNRWIDQSTHTAHGFRAVGGRCYMGGLT